MSIIIGWKNDLKFPLLKRIVIKIEKIIKLAKVNEKLKLFQNDNNKKNA